MMRGDNINSKVSPYKIPKVIEFMNQLPMSAMGKALKRELRKTIIRQASVPEEHELSFKD